MDWFGAIVRLNSLNGMPIHRLLAFGTRGTLNFWLCWLSKRRLKLLRHIVPSLFAGGSAIGLSATGAQRFRYDFSLPMMRSACAYSLPVARTISGGVAMHKYRVAIFWFRPPAIAGLLNPSAIFAASDGGSWSGSIILASTARWRSVTLRWLTWLERFQYVYYSCR